MNTVTKKTKVERNGWLRIQAPPELENQEVDVIIVPKRPSSSVREAAWRRLCNETQSLPSAQDITEEDIQKEIDEHRAGQ